MVLIRPSQLIFHPATWRKAQVLLGGGWMRYCMNRLHLMPADDARATSGFRQPVFWRGKSTLAGLNRPMRLRVTYGGLRFEDARIYAVYVGRNRMVSATV